MRTTLDLPDELYREPKRRAAEEGVPLKRLVAELLRRALLAPGAAAPTGRRWRRWRGGRRFWRRKRSPTPGTPSTPGRFATGEEEADWGLAFTRVTALGLVRLLTHPRAAGSEALAASKA